MHRAQRQSPALSASNRGRHGRLNDGRSPTTVLRDLFTLSSVLRRAVKAGELTENPVRRIDKPRIDRQTRHVPLNEEALNTLRRWREQSEPKARVFDIATGFKGAWLKLLKRARISHFRWHDLRQNAELGKMPNGCA
jgi:hypothetical protein